MLNLIEVHMQNRKWLDDKANEYPHVCHTKAKYPRPDDADKKMPHVHFVCAPTTKTTREWRFKTAEDMSVFKSLYVTLETKS